MLESANVSLVVIYGGFFKTINNLGERKATRAINELMAVAKSQQNFMKTFGGRCRSDS